MSDDATREIFDILRVHGEALARIEGRMEAQPERCAGHQKVLNRIEADLRGNGKPGLISRVALLEEFQKDVRSLLVWIRVAAGTAFLAGLGFFAEKVYALLAKHGG